MKWTASQAPSRHFGRGRLPADRQQKHDKESCSERFRNIALGIAGLISSVAIPLVGFYFTDQQNRRSQVTEQADKSQETAARQAEQEREVARKFVELGIKILSDKPLSPNDPVRSWAIDVVNRYSAVPLTEKTQEALESGSFFEPGQISKQSVSDFDQKGYSRGVDVYEGNKVDFAAIAADGFSFAYIRATQGSSHADKTLGDFAARPQAAGLHVGLYHFFEPTDDASEQVAILVRALNSVKWDLPPVVDCEPTMSPTPDNYADILYGFTTQLAKAIGRNPIIYTGVGFGAARMDARFSQFPLFLADYSGFDRAAATPKLPKWWSKFTLWQIGVANRQPVKGIDMSVYKGSVADLAKVAIQ
jgi:lysozyme